MLAIVLTGQRVNGFVVPSIDMSDATFEQCSFCDERSERAGSRAVADALREYMTQNHINILLEQGNFYVLTNSKIIYVFLPIYSNQMNH